jgi:hypothetical protein
MRTSRLARWLISGALVAAAAATVPGGLTVESGVGAKALSSESAQGDTAVDEGNQLVTSSNGTDHFEWT